MTDRDKRGHRRRLRAGDIIIANPYGIWSREAFGGKRCEVLCTVPGGQWKVLVKFKGCYDYRHLFRHEMRLAKRPKKAS